MFELPEFNFLDFAFKMMPNIISIILVGGNFSYTQVVRGIESNKDTCFNFKSAQDSKFLCVKHGVTALTIVIASLSSGMSLIIISHFSDKPTIAQYGIYGGIIYIIISFVYIQKYDSEVFKLHSMLSNSPIKIFRKLGKHPSIWWNIINTIMISAYQLSIMSVNI